MQGVGGKHQHGQIHRAGQQQRPSHINLRAFELTLDRWLLAARVMVVHQRGVQVDGMRHHRSTQNRSGHQHRIRTLKTRNQPLGHFDGIRRGHEQTRDKAERDNQQHHDDDALECGLRFAALEPQHHSGDRTDDQAAEEHRQTEKQIQRDGAANHLRQIGGDGDDLGLHEEHEPAGVAHTFAQQLGQGFIGHNTELGGLVLDEHAHSVGEHQHPYQQVAVACAGRDVGGHVAWIHISHSGHERGPQNASERMAMRIFLVVRLIAGDSAFLLDFRRFLLNVCRSGACCRVWCCHIVFPYFLHTAPSYSAGMFRVSIHKRFADNWRMMSQSTEDTPFISLMKYATSPETRS